MHDPLNAFCTHSAACLQGALGGQLSGLTFAANDPARLTLFFLETDHDFNDDGVVDAADLQLETQFRIWFQEQASDPFTALPSELGKSGDEIEAKIPGFTRYVVAF